MIRRVARALVLLVLVGVAVTIWFLAQHAPTLLGEGGSVIEDWCAKQLRTIANDLLVPKFDFKTLDYQYPATVVLTGLSLTAGDEQVLTAKKLTIEFTDIPRSGKPLVIKSIQADSPTLRFLVGEDGDLIGFGNLLKEDGGKTGDDGGSSRPSDVFAIERLAISKGLLEYRPRGEDPMRWDDIYISMNTTPRRDEQGWYALRIAGAQDPIFKLTIDARLNIDTGVVEFAEATQLSVSLSSGSYEKIPQPIQDVVRKQQIVGDLVIRATGALSFDDAANTDLAVNAILTDGNMIYNRWVIPTERMEIDATFRGDQLNFDRISMNVMEGRLDAQAGLALGEQMTFDLQANATGLRLNRLLQGSDGEDNVEFDGAVDFRIAASGALGDVSRLSGFGTMDITEGKLFNLPVLGKTFGAIGRQLRLARDSTDKAHAEYTLYGDRVHLESFTASSTMLAGRGDGDFFYDGRLKLRFNMGPLKKLESMLGPIGDVLSKVTDNIVAYEVTGTIDKPKLRIRPLRIGR